MRKKTSLMLDDEFLKYCELNQVTDVEALAKKIFLRGFAIEKYGETPSSAKGKQVEVINEVVDLPSAVIQIEKLVDIDDLPIEISISA